MPAFIKHLDAFANHKYLNLFIGLFLLGCGLNEIIQELEHTFTPKAHHGVAAFGFIHSFKSLSMVLKGAKAFA